MWLFRKKKNKKVDVPVSNESVVEVNTSGHNSKDGMASIIDESVPGAAVDNFKKEPKFIYGDKYIGFMLDTKDIGGLNKKSHQDEGKGQIIEHINSGEFQAYVPSDLLKEEKIVFVGSKETLDGMDEFSLLRDVKYTIVLVDGDGDIEPTDDKITLEQIIQYRGGNSSVSEFVLNYIPSIFDEVDDSNDMSEVQFNPLQEIVSDVSPKEDISEDEDQTYDSDDVTDDDEVQESIVGNIDNYASQNTSQNDDPFSDGVVKEDADIYVNKDDVVKSLTRVFYSGDLDLKVDTEAFDAVFKGFADYTPFVEKESDSFLENELNAMCREANLDLGRKRKEHVHELQKMFYSLMSTHATKIVEDLDYQNPDTYYGKQYVSLSDQRLEKETSSDFDRVVSDRTAAIKKTYDDMLERILTDAKRKAEAAFNDRYGDEIKAEMDSIQVDRKKEIEKEFNDSVKTMHSDRRIEAQKYFSLHTNETLLKLLEKHQEFVKQEAIEYQKWNNRMFYFRDNKRKDEVKRIEVLSEELKQVEKAEVVQREYQAKLDKMQSELEADKVSLRSEIDELNRSHKQQILILQDEHVKTLTDKNNELDKKSKDYEVLMDKYHDLDNIKTEEFKHRIAQIEDERDAWMRKTEATERMNKKISKIMVAVMSISVVCALLVGILFGTYGSKILGDLPTKQSLPIIKPKQEKTDKTDAKVEKIDKSKKDVGEKVNDAVEKSKLQNQNKRVEKPKIINNKPINKPINKPGN